ncbi:hypothetical protein CYMTET_22056 [Cymbomonas tetramitiformis]|uniref:Uncharacterized protein n=1 Tax=Cymbomonas tetramitiformis TaxID=36881 RepID=A0AAE0G0X3_9CHLO|nr:hypothetical protein CYMTET_22056 [Cymbomonas tetramitiformis]
MFSLSLMTLGKLQTHSNVFFITALLLCWGGAFSSAADEFPTWKGERLSENELDKTKTTNVILQAPLTE